MSKDIPYWWVTAYKEMMLSINNIPDFGPEQPADIMYIDISGEVRSQLSGNTLAFKAKIKPPEV